MNKDLSSSITCKNCGYIFTGNYCNRCGERVYHDHHKSIPHFFEDALHFVTHFEGTLLTTLKTIFTKPGLLSLDYCNGKRKKYFKPLSFFLVLVVLYLLFPLFPGLNMRMRYYPYLLGRFAKNWIETKMLSRHVSQDELAELFAHNAEKWSKVLLLVIIPLSAAGLWLLHPKKRAYFFDHLVLSTEISSFFLVVNFFIWAAIVLLLSRILPAYWFSDGGLLVNGGYLFVGLFVISAFRRFYNEKRWIAVLKMLLFIVLQAFIVYFAYKFLLFVAVMLSL